MIEFQTEKHTDEQIFRSLNPLLAAWFKHKFGSFTEPQKYAILNIHGHENTLVTAPTGTGKTLAGFSAILSELLNLSEASQLEDRVYCIYVSPLRALNNDIKRNLLEPLEEIQKAAKKIGKSIDIRVGVRTGDTTTSERQAMLRKPPHILITTPESIAIVLNAPRFKQIIQNADWAIIDEIHALASNKRGVHLSLSLERLQELNPQLCRIGLSATIAPLKEIAMFLVGMESEKENRPCKIVDVSHIKKLDLKVLSPLSDMIHVSQQQIQDSLYGMLDKLIQDHRTTLVFTNTRSATERVVHHLKEKFPINYTANIGAHHSSLSREMRLNVEERLKQGKLKVCVSSTSLELGIDIGYIDLVVLLGSPKSVARALQRCGRAGHRLHDIVKGRIVVLDRDDLVECAILLKDAVEKKLDLVSIPQNCLDVLAQHIYGIAIDQTRSAEGVYRLIKHSYSYRNLSRSDFYEIVDYLSGEYASLESRSVYAKIWHDEKTGMIGKRGKLARVLYMTNIGTIPDEAKVVVKIKDYKIGTLDEAFLEKLKKGDVFVLGGESYVFKFASGMTVQVAPAYKRPPTVPHWVSEMLPLSFELAIDIGKFRELLAEKFAVKKSRKEIIDFILKYAYVDSNSANAIYEYFLEQFMYADMPSHKKLVIENFADENGFHHIFHSLYGRRTNDALSKALAYTFGRIIHQDVAIVMNDNGFILTTNRPVTVSKAISALMRSNLREVLGYAIRDTEILKRRFRHCATRALMILRNYKGREKTVGRQQMNSRLLLSAVKRISEDFPILKETRREIMEDYMDIESTEKVLQGMRESKIKVKEISTESPSPFAFNLFAEGYSDILKMEGRLAFIKRMHAKVMEKIGEKASEA